MIQLYKEIYNSKVLNLFFEDPEGTYYIREIARRTGLNPNTVLRDVKLLEKEELLTTKKTKAILEVKSNRENPKFFQLKRLSNMKNMLTSGLIEYLDEKYNTPSAIILLGSYSRGEDTAKSDIDIAVITTREIKLDLSKFEGTFKRKIQIHEIQTKRVSKNFLNNLANGIVLKGYLEI